MVIPGTGYADVMRSVAALYLPDECVIVRRTRTFNDSGGWTDSETTIATVACRLADQAEGSERTIGGAARADAPYIITMPHDTNVSTSDAIQHDGRTYEIAAITRGTVNLTKRAAVRPR